MVRAGVGGAGMNACVRRILLVPTIRRVTTVMIIHLETALMPAFEVAAAEC